MASGTRSFIAVLSLLAIVVLAGGVAKADVFTAESGSATLTGSMEGTDVIKVHAGEVKCTTVKYTGSTSSSSLEAVTLTPTYSGCTFAGLAATISMNGCDYLVKINAAAGNTTGTEDIVCPAGKEITVTAPSVGTPKCVLHIPAQTGLGPGSAANIGSGTTREITVSKNATNIKYSQTAGTAEVGNCATADSTTGGTYTGRATVTAETSGGVHIGVFLS